MDKLKKVIQKIECPECGKTQLFLTCRGVMQYCRLYKSDPIDVRKGAPVHVGRIEEVEDDWGPYGEVIVEVRCEYCDYEDLPTAFGFGSTVPAENNNDWSGMVLTIGNGKETTFSIDDEHRRRYHGEE